MRVWRWDRDGLLERVGEGMEEGKFGGYLFIKVKGYAGGLRGGIGS